MVFFFSYTAFASGGKAKWKIYQQHANFYFKVLRIIHQIAFVLQVKVTFHIVLLSQDYATQDIYLLLKENFSEFDSHAPSFFNRRQIFPSIRGTSHSKSDCTTCTVIDPFRQRSN